MKRNSYADLGLVVAVAVFIILLIKSSIFGLSWFSLVCLVLTVAYFAISYFNSSHSSVVRRATTAYLLLMLFSLVGVVLFDKNAHPKMHAFEGAAVDSVVEEEFVIEDRDIPVEIVPQDTLNVDSLAEDTLSSDLPTETPTLPDTEDEIL
jgi:hypothetical protein